MLFHPYTPHPYYPLPRVPVKALLGALASVLYVATIWFANYLIEHYGFVSVGFGLAAPAGVYAAGLALTLRDVTQRLVGRKAVILCIIAGAALSYTISPAFATASAIAFLVSEACDFAVYTPLSQRTFLGAILASNVVGAVIDSLLFLWIAFGSLAFFWGQFIGKMWVTVVSVVLIAVICGVYRKVGGARSSSISAPINPIG